MLLPVFRKSYLYLPIRCLATAVEKPALSKLRKKTGFPFINCKNALLKFDNDLVQAETWLKEEAQKAGWAKATKLQTRPMSQGLIGIISDETSATMIEVNCETDFVARNLKFVDLVANLTVGCKNYFNTLSSNKLLLNQEQVNSLETASGQTVADVVAYNVGNIGENMAIRRALYMVAAPNTKLYTQVHVSGDGLNLSNDYGCRLGKYGTIVEIEHLEQTEQLESTDGGEEMEESKEKDTWNVPVEICQHIIGMNPKTIGTTEDQRVKKKADETKLIFQEFLIHPRMTVQDVLKHSRLQVLDFARFECGESLGDDV